MTVLVVGATGSIGRFVQQGQRASARVPVFYDLYTDDEKKQEPLRTPLVIETRAIPRPRCWFEP